MVETSGPWFRNSICEAARCEDRASGQHLPADDGREAKGTKEPGASMGSSLLLVGRVRCDKPLSENGPAVFAQVPTHVCRRASGKLDCEVS